MAKKLIIGGLIVVLVGALGLAIYNYNQTNQGLHAGQALAYGNGGGQGSRGGVADGNGAPTEGNANGGYRGGRGGDEVAPGSGEQGQANGKGQTGEAPQGRTDNESSVPDPQAHVEEWLTISGQVTNVDATSLTLKTDDGQTLNIDLGPEWFWSAQGVALDAGDHVTVQAFEEDGEIKVGQISLGDGTPLQLRDTDGRPLWAGRGRGGGRQ
jgi:hypothetical protein